MEDNEIYIKNDTSVYECYYEKGRLVSCYDRDYYSPREYEYEYDTNGNPVKMRENHMNEEMTLTYTDIKVSELPIEDRLALSETTNGVIGKSGAYTRVVYCNPELTSCWRGALANTLLKKVEDKDRDENCTLNWTYYLNDKRVSISCYRSGEFMGTIEYSWYLK